MAENIKTQKPQEEEKVLEPEIVQPQPEVDSKQMERYLDLSGNKPIIYGVGALVMLGLTGYVCYKVGKKKGESLSNQ